MELSFEHDEPEDFVVSQWQKKSKSLIYLIYRWSMVIYYFYVVILILNIAIDRDQLGTHFTLLTTLASWMNMINSLLSAYIVTAYYLDRLPIDKVMTTPLKASWYLSQLSTVFAICVSSAYWSKGYQGEVIDLDNILKHVMNSVMVLIDLFIVKYPHRFSHFIYSMLFGSIYVFFNYAYTISSHSNVVYHLANWNLKPMESLIFSTFSVIFAAFVHFIISLLHILRKKICIQVNSKNNADETNQQH